MHDDGSVGMVSALRIALLGATATALDNGVARTPVMGYNTWYDVGGEINSTYIEATAAAMADRGLVAAG